MPRLDMQIILARLRQDLSAVQKSGTTTSELCDSPTTSAKGPIFRTVRQKLIPVRK